MKGRLAVKDAATRSRNPLPRMSCSSSSSRPMKSVRLTLGSARPAGARSSFSSPGACRGKLRCSVI